MLKFGGNVDNFYAADIDGEDISAYDDKMQALYEAIKDAEDSSTSYGKGLFLISKEKAGFTEWGKSGSGNYWQVLKKVAENARSPPLLISTYPKLRLPVMKSSSRKPMKRQILDRWC